MTSTLPPCRIQCKRCEKDIVYVGFHMIHKQEEEEGNKITIQINEKCYMCDILDVFDTLEKKQYLSYEMFKQISDSLFSQYFTNLHNMQVLLHSLRYEMSDDEISLLKVDQIKYLLFRKYEEECKTRNQMMDIIEDEIIRYSECIYEIISRLKEFVNKVKECEKMVNECDECVKENDKIKVCEKCKEKINS